MTRLNFREACLLDASGELGPKARQAFLEYIRKNPAANQEYEEIRAQYESLKSLPGTELSARDLRLIPAQLSNSLRIAFRQRLSEKRAATRWMFIRWAMGSIAVSAAMIALTIFVVGPQSSASTRHDREQVAKIHATIDHYAAMNDQAVSPYDQAVTDVEASIRQLQTESPTLAEVYDRNMGDLLDVLANQPTNSSERADPPLPPGSL